MDIVHCTGHANNAPLLRDGNGKVVIQAVARDWRSAIDSALGRAARALMRLWQRSRQQGRPQRSERPDRAAATDAGGRALQVAARRPPALPRA